MVKVIFLSLNNPLKFGKYQHRQIKAKNAFIEQNYSSPSEGEELSKKFNQRVTAVGKIVSS